MSIPPVSMNKESLTLQLANNNEVKNVQDQPKATELKNDTVEISNTQENVKKPKKTLLERWANFVGSMKKAGTNIVEYTKGGAKGIVHFVTGTVAGVGAIFTIDKIKQASKAVKKAGKEVAEEGTKQAKNSVVGEFIKRFTKGISKNFSKEGIKATLKSGKGKLAIAGGVLIGALAFVKQIYKAKLAANEKNAMTDHKYVKTPVVSK